MKTTATATRFPAGVAAGAVLITRAGCDTLRLVEFAQIKWTWDILQLDLDGPVIDGAEIADSYTCLVSACQAANQLNQMAQVTGERFVFLVQRHPAADEPAQQSDIEF